MAVSDESPEKGRRKRLAPVSREGTPDESGYTAASIEVLEGLEPVRGGGPACISAAPTRPGCITSSPR